MSKPLPIPPPKPGHWRRWLAVCGLLLVVLVAGTIAAVPWLLATPTGQRWLTHRANLALAPGRIAWKSLRVSWFGPTRLTDLTLIDAQGDTVLAATNARLDRTLGQLLFDRPRFGTLDLADARLDVERRPDGTIDLYETIRPVLRRDRARGSRC